MSRATIAPITFPAVDPAAIAAKNAAARRSIKREIEELLRISREADEAAFRLIVLLDLNEPDPDLEDGEDDEHTLGGGMGDQEHDTADDECSLGWTLAIHQDGRKWRGEVTGIWGHDLEAEHDGREPDADLEPDADDEAGGDEDEGEADRNPAYFARLQARRAKAVPA